MAIDECDESPADPGQEHDEVDGNVAEVDDSDESVGNEVSARVSISVHRELVELARAENVSVDELVGELLVEALALRDARNMRRRGRAGDNRRDRLDNRGSRRSYNEIMDDKASFLEYVRNVEQDCGGRRGQGRRGGGRRRNRNSGGDSD